MQNKVATTYEDLQSLKLIKLAKENYPLSQASLNSTIKSIFQASEIILLNIIDLIKRINKDCNENKFNKVNLKLEWIYSLHLVLSELGLTIQGLSYSKNDKNLSFISISESPNFKLYLNILKETDEILKKKSVLSEDNLFKIIFYKKKHNCFLNFIHLFQICNHESVIWERYLSNIPIHNVEKNYNKLIATDILSDAVFSRTIKDESFFTQFRGLHQVPEILTTEANEHLDKIITLINEDKCMEEIYFHLYTSKLLFKVSVSCLTPLIKNLNVIEYHKIRKYLGLTSGSHSIEIHYKIFNDKYQKLCIEVLQYISNKKYINNESYLENLLLKELIELRLNIDLWKGRHMHLPRINLGKKSKSLIGSVDAVETVKKMWHNNVLSNSLNLLLNYPIPLDTLTTEQPIQIYLESSESFDQKLSDVIGKVTMAEFPDVQNRDGYFSQRCPFISSENKFNEMT